MFRRQNPMENRQSSRPATTSSTASARSTIAAERARILLGCYRRNDAIDPDSYVLAITAVLAMFDPELIREVTDPRTGISTDERYAKWPPNSGELKLYCEGKAAVKARIQRYAAMPKPDFSRPRLSAPEPRPGRRANLLVRRGMPRYDEMCERARSGNADPAEFQFVPEGIRVSLAWWDRSRIGEWREIEPFRHEREAAE